MASKEDKTGKKKPNKPKNVKFSQAAGSNEIKITWDYGDGATSGEKKWTKSTKVEVTSYETDGKKHSTKTYSVPATTKTCTHTINLPSWYPNKGKPKLGKYIVSIKSANDGGTSDAATATCTIKKPNHPTKVTTSVDYGTGEVTASAEAVNHKRSDGKGYRTKTVVELLRYSESNVTLKVVKTKSRGTEAGTVTADVYDASKDSVTDSRVVFVTRAINMGPAGDSEESFGEDVNFSRPNIPTVKKISRTGESVTATISVTLSTNADFRRPVDTITLQRLRDADDSLTAEQAALQPGWDDVASSDGNCKGLTDAMADALPTEGGKRTWYRLKSVHGNFAPVYSTPATTDWLHKAQAPASVGPVAIQSLTTREDGTSLVAVLSWSATIGGVEVSWSADNGAWSSVTGPKTHELVATSPATVVIDGLEEGVMVYVKARSYDDSGSSKVYGGYSATATATPMSKPKNLTLSAPSSVLRGDGIPLVWTFESEKPQTAWSVSSGGTVVASGSDAMGSAVVEPSAYGSASSIALSVSMTTGGAWAQSNQVTVAVSDAPSAYLSVPATLTAQPLTATVSTSAVDGAVIATVTSCGCTQGTTSDEPAQDDGEVVWSRRFKHSNLEWSGETTLFATITADEGLDLREGAEYVLSVTVVSETTSLSTAADPATFTVKWAHRAGEPSGTVTPDPQNMSCTIVVEAPDDAVETDVFDLYRVTTSGEYLIASGMAFGEALVDPYAPYTGRSSGAELSYRAVTRTADGDTMGAELPYELHGAGVRLDWDGSSCHLPYNVVSTDSWEKDFEARKHMDGGVGGYWTDGAIHRKKASTDLVRLDQETWSALKEAAGHAGPVFFRSSDGDAFPADVQVGEVESSYGSKTVSASIDATEIGLVAEFGARPEEA